MKVMPTVGYLNEIVLGVGVLSWSGWALHMAFALILSLSKEILMPSGTEMKFLRGMLSHCFEIMPISLFFIMIMPLVIQLGDTENFLRAIDITFINDWPAKSPDLNPNEHLLDNLDQCVRRHPIQLSNIIQLRQTLIQEWNNIPQAEIKTLIRFICQPCQTVLHAEVGHTGINLGF